MTHSAFRVVINQRIALNSLKRMQYKKEGRGIQNFTIRPTTSQQKGFTLSSDKKAAQPIPITGSHDL